MKKLFLFVTAIGAVTFLNSCSSDDNGSSDSSGNPGGTISVKINGESKTFNNVVVDKEDFVYDGVTTTYVTATGTIGNSTNELISFEVEMGEVGSQTSFFLKYYNGTTHYELSPQINSVVQTNSNNKLKGNFSGTLDAYNGSGEMVSVNLTDGSYDITH